MKAPYVGLPVPARLVAGLLAASAALPIPAGAGEKIEFSRPAQPMTMKPMTERDLGTRPFNFQRSDSPAVPEVSAEAVLPSVEYLNNQVRVLQELIERNSTVGSLFEESSDPNLESGYGDDLEGEDSGIHDLLDRLDDRRRRAMEFGNNERSERFSEDERRRRADDPQRSFDRLGSNEPGTDPGTGLGQPARDEGFLSRGAETPGNARTDFLGRDLGRRGDNLPAAAAFGARPTPGMSLGESREAKAWTERREDWQRLLKGGSGVPGGLGAPGGSPLAGPAPGAARSLSDLNRGPASPAAADPMAATRSLSLPSRSLGLDPGLGGRASSSGLGGGLNPEPRQRPMEMFQRKHDTRIPTRAF